MSNLKVLSGRNYSRERDHWPCNCCGMAYVNRAAPYKQPPREAGKGIRVIFGEHGKDKDTNKVSRNIVQTKNGPLTVLVRFEE